MQNYPDYQVNFSNCDQEPIHIIGQIQRHGFLLVLNLKTLVVEQASQNTEEYLGIPLEELLGQRLPIVLSDSDTVLTAESLLEPGPQNPQLITLGKKQFLGFCHVSERKIILEGERYHAFSDEEKLAHNRTLTELYLKLNQLDDLGQAAEAVATTLQEVLQYDRVNVLQFDSDWNSDVIAESKTAQAESFVGHHFPASDIPEPARELLRKKHVRQITDVNAPALQIVPYLHPNTGQPTNVLQSELRNPSELHLEYVRNMKVASTISFSIMVKEQLWGIIACHNLNPVYINVWCRQLCDLIVKTFANVLASIQEKRDQEQYNQFKLTEQALVYLMQGNSDLGHALFHHEPTLLQLTESTGAALLLEGQLTTAGHTPTDAQILSLVDWLSGHESKRVLITRKLAQQFPEANDYQELASGLLALEISKYNQEYLLFFKPEIKEKRIWAGNPEKAERDEEGRLHPRKSFKQWEEIVKGTSQPWSANEVEIVQVLLKDLVAIRLRNQADKLQRLNQELRQTAAELQSKNHQLEDFSRIVAHNFRSPLANIIGLHQLYQDQPTPENAAFALQHIKTVADNMFQSINDLNNILRTQLVQDLPIELVSLEDIVGREVQNLEAVILQSSAQIETNLQVSHLTAPRPYIESILHNFISNALKYRSPDRLPKVQVNSWLEQNQLHISVADNGLGMDLNKVGPDLFGLYKTFHRHQDAKGLGLYLTNIQVKALGGSISVQSALSQGTTFTVIFEPGKHLPLNVEEHEEVCQEQQ